MPSARDTWSYRHKLQFDPLIQRLRNSQRIVCAAFAADAIGILPAVFSSLHQTSLLKFRRPRQ